MERYASGGMFWVDVFARRMPPDEWGIVVSEFAHHVRAALNNTVNEIAVARGAGRSDLAFPIFTSKAEFAQRGRRLVRGLSWLDQKIVAAAQPFETHPAEPDRAPLALLAVMNNNDKYRSVPVAAGANPSGAVGQNANLPPGTVVDWGTIGMHLLTKDPVPLAFASIRWPPGATPVDPGLAVRVDWDVRLGGEDERLAYRPLLPTLAEIQAAVSELVAELREGARAGGPAARSP